MPCLQFGDAAESIRKYIIVNIFSYRKQRPESSQGKAYQGTSHESEIRGKLIGCQKVKI